MNRYHVTQYAIPPDQQRRTVLVQAIDAPTAHQAISYAYPGIQATAAPDEDIAEWRPDPTPDGHAILIEAEPAPPSQYGALREAIARAAIAEHLLEAAIGELARVAEIDHDKAYIGLLSLSEWTPGDPLTDEQCAEFMQSAQEPSQ